MSSSVTPDPGLIDRQHSTPPTSWRDRSNHQGGFTKKARAVRLAPEKFLPRRTHTGPGRRKFIFVVGARKTATAPFLALLHSSKRSLLLPKSPSPSFLSSGLFIGPDSQAPRIDVSAPRFPLRTWRSRSSRRALTKAKFRLGLVRSLFRQSAHDGSGNTHRHRICIESSIA